VTAGHKTNNFLNYEKLWKQTFLKCYYKKYEKLWKQTFLNCVDCILAQVLTSTTGINYVADTGYGKEQIVFYWQSFKATVNHWDRSK